MLVITLFLIDYILSSRVSSIISITRGSFTKNCLLSFCTTLRNHGVFNSTHCLPSCVGWGQIFCTRRGFLLWCLALVFLVLAIGSLARMLVRHWWWIWSKRSSMPTFSNIQICAFFLFYYVAYVYSFGKILDLLLTLIFVGLCDK